MADAILEFLLPHDRWATEQLLTASEALSDEQLDRPFAIGPGSLRLTLVHILQVIRGWDNAIQQRTETDTLAATASIAELRAAANRIYDDFAETCRAATPDPLVLARRGQSMTAPRRAVLSHVLTHGTHHRAQALNMLRQLGANPLPPSSLLQWMLMTGAATMSTPS
jgi:uncharacterized damage-inducible protein DinB